MKITNERKEELNNFCLNFGLKFQNFEVLNRAFVHTSYTNENSLNYLESYERLEFLGDAVLKIVISDFLFKNFETLHEGALTNHRAWVVSDKQIAELARKINLGKLILLGRNEESLGGRDKTSILACAFEAFLGAIYLEYKQLGLKAAYDFLVENFEQEFLNSAPSNYKALLQEYTQGQNKTLPVYKILDEFGMSHDKTYVTGVYYNGVLIAQGEGKSKKEAEQAAAKAALKELRACDE